MGRKPPRDFSRWRIDQEGISQRGGFPPHKKTTRQTSAKRTAVFIQSARYSLFPIPYSLFSIPYSLTSAGSLITDTVATTEFAVIHDVRGDSQNDNS